MGREQDWEEIKKANAKYEQRIKDQFGGVDLLKLKKDTKNTTQKIYKTNEQLKKVLKIIAIFQIILVSFIIIFGTWFYISYMKATQKRVSVDVVENLKDMYGINAKIIEKDLDEKGNGKLILKSKGKDKITFVAIKKFGSFEFDYYDRCLKIAFEKSNNDVKEVFTPEEKYTELGIMEYSLNAKTEGLDGIANVVEKYAELRKNAPDFFGYTWKINMKVDDFSDQLYSEGLEETTESICRREQCKYVIFCIDNGESEKLTSQEIERYYKPFVLKAYLNGRPIYTEMMDEQIQRTILYDYENEEYCVPIECFEDVEGVQIQYTPNKIPIEMTYNGKIYKIDNGNEDLINNVIPQTVGTSKLEKIFGVKFEFDMKNKIINIVIR